MTPIFPLLLLTINSLFAQTPEKISYQAVIRDNAQALVTSSDVDLKILIREGSVKGTAVYEETHYTTTNSNGFVSLQIGTGIVNRGSFENINWAKGFYYIESQVDPTGSSNYSITGVSQILSVPYALHSKTAENFSGAISEAKPQIFIIILMRILTDLKLHLKVGTKMLPMILMENIPVSPDCQISILKVKSSNFFREMKVQVGLPSL